jgi:hypothetical protein
VRLHYTHHMPVGTLLIYDGVKVKKTHDSKHHPFPWTSEHGTEYGDEWAASVLDKGEAEMLDDEGADRG